jgi:bifunctional DNA-binding transcriptional regulator/antitoxin component of YhaV-PrlF toxin-antitoxin module
LSKNRDLRIYFLYGQIHLAVNDLYHPGNFRISREIMTDTITPLTGKALLQKVKELSHLPRRETAKRCGYYSITKNDQTRVNLTDFYDAVLGAKGVPLDPEGAKDGRGREPTYRVSVHKNGQIVIGATYTQAMGLRPGDEFEIKLGYKHIHLKQVDSDGSKTDEDDAQEDAEE